jgi:hypothetical protein
MYHTDPDITISLRYLDNVSPQAYLDNYQFNYQFFGPARARQDRAIQPGVKSSVQTLTSLDIIGSSLKVNYILLYSLVGDMNSKHVKYCQEFHQAQGSGFRTIKVISDPES